MDDADRLKLYQGMADVSRKWVATLDAKAGFIAAINAALLGFIWSSAKLPEAGARWPHTLGVVSTAFSLLSLCLAMGVVVPRIRVAFAAAPDAPDAPDATASRQSRIVLRFCGDEVFARPVRPLCGRRMATVRGRSRARSPGATPRDLPCGICEELQRPARWVGMVCGIGDDRPGHRRQDGGVAMESNTRNYTSDDSDARIRDILDAPRGNYLEVDEIPSRARLTYENGFYVKCAAVFIDIRGSSSLPDLHSRPVLGKDLPRLYLGMYRCTEPLPVLQGDLCGG